MSDFLIKKGGLEYSESSFNCLFSSYKQAARKRNYCWELSKEEAKIIFQSNCRYCRRPPAQVMSRKININGHFIYNGIDRVDNTKGYIIDNVVACCKRCNRAKRDMTLEEFNEWGLDFSNNYIKTLIEI